MRGKLLNLIGLASAAAALFCAGFALGYWDGFDDGVEVGTTIYLRADPVSGTPAVSHEPDAAKQ